MEGSHEGYLNRGSNSHKEVGYTAIHLNASAITHQRPVKLGSLLRLVLPYSVPDCHYAPQGDHRVERVWMIVLEYACQHHLFFAPGYEKC